MAAIIGLLLIYLLGAAMGWPQRGTEMVLAAHSEGADESHAPPPGVEITAEGEIERIPSYYAVIPFVLLLGAIAVLPLLHWTEHWWESNLNRFYVAACLGLIILFYYLVFYSHPIELHWPAHAVVEPVAGETFQLQVFLAVLANAMLAEYIPFIVLLFSLYTIAGGIRITGDLRARPLTNTNFLAIGGLLASLIGTTGAAMLLIRPLLETNAERRHVQHTVVFFIFVVCNCGGCLLPIGDPPLFLGYLQGVDFAWTLTLWPEWLFVNGVLLSVYFLADTFYFHPHETPQDIARDETMIRGLKFSGLKLNGILLIGVVFSVALLDPSKAVPGTHWHAWMYLREAAQLTLVALSLLLGSRAVRQANNFNYNAIIEVAALFFGIFICMQPALQILSVKGSTLGLDTTHEFFWATGTLSSVLDNAPTYLVFFETAGALPSQGEMMAGVNEGLLTAVSLGAVFMGAMTYIGNGPNFMVKAIAEKTGVRMPSFFGYMVYSVCVLLPIFALMTWIFF